MNGLSLMMKRWLSHLSTTHFTLRRCFPPEVLEQPGLPVIVFHPAADAPKAEQPQPDAVPEQSAPEQEPAPQAAPPEPEEERCPFAQPDWKPTTALDHQAVDLVHQLESLMTV